MKKYSQIYYKGVVFGLGFLSIIGITGVAYGAYVAMTSVNTGGTLTASSYNQLIENVSTLKTTVDGLSNVPAGFVGAFNLSTCPTGWIAANGSNGTPDLRGEFIRGLDSGRGVDSGRSLGSLQGGSLVMNTYNKTSGVLYGLSHEGDNRLGYDVAMTDSSKQYYRGFSGLTGSYVAWTTGQVDNAYVKMTRPRNVALLYCVKQ